MRELLNKRNLMVMGGILALFAVGLVGFYMFSAPYGDGLEVTMKNAGVNEPEPVFSGLLDYGGNYASSLVMGIAGFFITLLVSLALLRFLRGPGPAGEHAGTGRDNAPPRD